MKLSTKSRYALRAIIDLAVHSKDEHVSLANIAQRQKLSDNYLENMFSTLKKEGILYSVKGQSGGYRLAKPAENITAGDIIRAIEGNLSVLDAVRPDIPVRKLLKEMVWDRLDQSVNEALDAATISSLAEDYAKRCI